MFGLFYSLVRTVHTVLHVCATDKKILLRDVHSLVQRLKNNFLSASTAETKTKIVFRTFCREFDCDCRRQQVSTDAVAPDVAT